MILNKLLVMTTCLLAGMSVLSQDELHLDPERTVGPEKCGECHKSEMAVWKETRHFKSFFELTQSDEARTIAEKMDMKRIKRESLCMRCHFTSLPEEGIIKPVAGTSCESCHGAAKDWVDVHNDYGGKDVKKEQETPEHRVQRIQKSKEGGQIRPENLYDVAQNCFQCHTVPNEKLINVGGHKLGSSFELVSYSQGEVRHNFLRSSDGKTNVALEQSDKRIMYVIGQALELEYSLRGLAQAKEKDKFGMAMAKRVQRANGILKNIYEIINNFQVRKMIGISNSVRLKLNNATELLAAADQVQEHAKALQAALEKEDLSGLDALLPEPSVYKGTALDK